MYAPELEGSLIAGGSKVNSNAGLFVLKGMVAATEGKGVTDEIEDEEEAKALGDGTSLEFRVAAIAFFAPRESA
jgi:hypothetical protein